MKTKILLLLLVILFCLPAVSFAKDYDLYVDDSAGGGGNGSQGSPFNQIQEAIDKASGSTDIYIRKGTYSGDITVAKKVRLYGADRDKTIIDGAVTMKDDSSIEDLTVKGGYSSVTIAKDADATIDDCRIRKFTKMGINAEAGGGKVTVINSIIEDGDGKGFYIQRGKEAYIAGNRVSDNREEGIDVRSKVDGEIRNNNVYDNGESGIEIIIGSSGVRIVNNTLMNNKSSGIATQFYKELAKPGKIEIKGNKISSNKNYGLDCVRPQGGSPSDNYWKDSLELINNSIEKNKKGAINPFCNILDAVEEDEAEDNTIVEGEPEENEEDQSGSESEVEAEAALKARQEEEQRLKREDLTNQIEMALEEQKQLAAVVEQDVRALKKDNVFRLLLIGSNKKKLEVLEAEIEANQAKLREMDTLISQLEAEGGEDVVLTETLMEETAKLRSQKKFLKEREERFNFLDWVKRILLLDLYLNEE